MQRQAAAGIDGDAPIRGAEADDVGLAAVERDQPPHAIDAVSGVGDLRRAHVDPRDGLRGGAADEQRERQRAAHRQTLGLRKRRAQPRDVAAAANGEPHVRVAQPVDAAADARRNACDARVEVRRQESVVVDVDPPAHAVHGSAETADGDARSVEERRGREMCGDGAACVCETGIARVNAAQRAGTHPHRGRIEHEVDGRRNRQLRGSPTLVDVAGRCVDDAAALNEEEPVGALAVAQGGDVVRARRRVDVGVCRDVGHVETPRARQRVAALVHDRNGAVANCRAEDRGRSLGALVGRKLRNRHVIRSVATAENRDVRRLDVDALQSEEAAAAGQQVAQIVRNRQTGDRRDRLAALRRDGHVDEDRAARPQRRVGEVQTNVRRALDRRDDREAQQRLPLPESKRDHRHQRNSGAPPKPAPLLALHCQVLSPASLEILRGKPLPAVEPRRA